MAPPVCGSMNYRALHAAHRETTRAMRAAVTRRCQNAEHSGAPISLLTKDSAMERFSESTGTMVENGCHFFDLMRLITGANPIPGPPQTAGQSGQSAGGAL